MKMYVVTSQSPPFGLAGGGSQKSRTYDAIRAAGDVGIGREQICKNTGLPKQRVWFYLSELRRGGLIKRMGDAVDPTTLSPADSKLHALAMVENALMINAAEHLQKCPTCKITNDDTKRCEPYKQTLRSFLKYNKIKALALGAKTAGEEASALRMAMVELVKMVF